MSEEKEILAKLEELIAKRIEKRISFLSSQYVQMTADRAQDMLDKRAELAAYKDVQDNIVILKKQALVAKNP